MEEKINEAMMLEVADQVLGGQEKEKKEVTKELEQLQAMQKEESNWSTNSTLLACISGISI